ncbi:MAG: exo-alpha-sialidase [Planctomyces sp.]|nr:exo-alpha-sialidase [Planctomyces sp.]
MAADEKALPPREILDLSLVPPVINTQPGPEYSPAQLDYSMTIGIERTPKGRLWAAWVAGGDSDKGFFVLGRSDDDGRTWKSPQLVIDPPEASTGLKRRVLVGNLWTDPTGKLLLFFDQSMGYFDGRAGNWAITCANPDDETPVWSEPRRIWDGCTLNKPTVLQSGEWMLPVSLWDRGKIGPAELKTAAHELDQYRMANVLVSHDQGKSWTRRGGVAFPGPQFDEHMIVERKDGSLWMLARTTEGMAESISLDQGATWSEPKIAMPHVPTRFHIRRLASGNLLLVRHGNVDERTKNRTRLMAFLSSDEGRTWRGGLMLDDRDGVSYPDGFQSPDGRIYISYDRERAKEREVLLAVFREEDVLAGKIISPDARLRGVITKAMGGANPPKPLPDTAKFLPAQPVDPKILAMVEGSEGYWHSEALRNAEHDRTTIAYDGISPNKLVCDTTLRQLPDKSWALYLLAGDDIEPSPGNYIGVVKSLDQGKTWAPIQEVPTGLPRSGLTSGQGATEVMVHRAKLTMFFSTHSQTWGRDWQSWIMTSPNQGRAWSKPQLLPGRLGQFTFIRNHIVTKDGRIMVPFQHYEGPAADVPPPPPEDRPWHKALFHYVSNPRNGVLISDDHGKTWTEHGDIRLTTDDRYHGWAENNIVELEDGTIKMIIRGDRLGGVLYMAESTDGGKTWPEFAKKTDIPNPGSKATLYKLFENRVAMLHNPNPSHRSPLSLWISFDGMKTWPYRRVLVPESSDGPKGRLNYPDGFVSEDGYLHFAYDDNRHRAVYYGAKLPSYPIICFPSLNDK